MDNYMFQILNDDFNAFFLSDFHHQSLVLVPTAGAGHTSMLITTPESHCSQPLEFMVTPTSTMPHRQQALTPESAPLTGLSLDLNQGQGSLQIPPFCSGIEN